MTKIKIEIKNRWTGKILFEYENENNTLKTTIIKAINDKAYLREADLRGADLRGADLYGADLRRADLREADLYGANLREADLREADLRRADLRRADLYGANLYGADWKKIKYLFQIIPEEGSFIAYKKLANQCLAKIEIPKKAKRLCNTVSRKCRASYVKTLQIWDSNGNEIKAERGERHYNTIYKVNRLTHPDSFDTNPFEDCSHGIHFFITKQEALDW